MLGKYINQFMADNELSVNLLCKYIGVYKTEEAARKNVSRCLKLWEEVKRKRT